MLTGALMTGPSFPPENVYSCLVSQFYIHAFKILIHKQEARLFYKFVNLLHPTQDILVADIDTCTCW